MQFLTFEQDDLQTLIDNVLDAFALLDPSKILIKIKLHVLIHIIANIRRRGPAVRFSTEIFECFNAIFRMCSVLSNHQAPSRDIALKFSDLDRVKHILSGGFWCQDGKWVQAGRDVRQLLRRTPIIQKHLGWTPEPTWDVGAIKPPTKKKQTVIHGKGHSMIQDAANPFNLPQINDDFVVGVYSTAASGDRCHVNSWGVFKLHVRYNLSHTSVQIFLLTQGAG